jgi:hypothetical protein
MPEAHKTYLKRVNHPSAWRADEISLDQVTIQLESRHLQALSKSLEKVNRNCISLENINRSNFTLASIAADLDQWYQEIINGKGLVRLQGFPVNDYTLKDLERMYWGLGSHFGTTVSQSVQGDFIGHVTDVAGKDPNARAYRNSLEIPPHTDLTDIIGMLSIQKAKQGGLSTYTSALSIHNQILQTKPELLEPLYQGYQMHRFGEEAPGDDPVTPYKVPVLFEKDGFVSARIVPEYIDMAEVALGKPMKPIEREAFDEFMRLSESDELQFSVMMEPGDITLTNNHTILHSRTAFFDDDDPDKRRHLLRLWLVTPDQRPIPDEMKLHHNEGILAQPGKTPYFEGDTALAANRGRYGSEAADAENLKGS